jgi:hypothetical protein
MKSPTINTDAVAIILEYVELQNNLISAFRQSFPQIKDGEILLDCPRDGCLLAEGEEWKFQRHGVGICFTGQESGKVVDVHVGILEYPRAFDAWRLAQYFEAIGIEKISYLSHFFEVVDEDDIEDLLNNFLKDNLIYIALEKRKLYILKS